MRKEAIELDEYPGVTVVVPCYNEEKTVGKTVHSLLALDYPKDKLHLILVDDGSRDNTWLELEKFSKHGNVRIFRKENGGKHTALNLGLEHTETSYVGCLDADSFVDPQALKRIMSYFLSEKDIMAVAPSIIVSNPKNVLQYAQKAEYEMAVYNKKMLGFLNGIHVTPGPFSIFRKEVFEKLGPYHKAHNTEDQEIALRMQANGYRIEHCPDAYVYTNTPDTVPKLYRQRLRWIYGFIKNSLDYRSLFFSRKHGHLAFFTLPSGFLSISSVIFLLIVIGSQLYGFVSRKVVQVQAAGFDLSLMHFKTDWFYFDTKASLFLSLVLYLLVIIALLRGRKMITGKYYLSKDIVYFFAVYTVLAPVWMLKAIYNSIFSKESSWTAERASKA